MYNNKILRLHGNKTNFAENKSLLKEYLLQSCQNDKAFNLFFMSDVPICRKIQQTLCTGLLVFVVMTMYT